MPRAMRIKGAGHLHHVTSRGNDGQVLFHVSQDFQIYLDLMGYARKVYPVKIYNYVLMDNHIHLLIEPTEDGSLSRFMEYVTKEYAKYYNSRNDHKGHVFQGRFKSFLVQEERYFFACSRYIDLNPVKAGLVQNPVDYFWSGYNALGYGGKTDIKVDLHDLYMQLGLNTEERQIAYRAFITHHQGEELDLLNRRAGVLGDREFKKRFKEKMD